MVTFIKSDLEFILEQIKIAEAHAGGQPLFGPGGLIPTYNIAAGLRTVDGSYNHLLPGQESWGAAGTAFPSSMLPTYRPAENVPVGFGPPGPTSYSPSNNPGSMVFDSSVRTISNLLVDQTLANPAAVLTALERAGSTAPLVDLPAVTAIYQAFKPASDAEYQARVVMQNAKKAADALGDGDPLTPPGPAEQAAIDAWTAATAAHATTLADLEAARAVRDAALVPFGIQMEGDNVRLPAIAPDEGLSAPFNSWFTLFGQFFDHGLDLVNKGGSGTVFIPLQPDDPLYVEGSQTNFMVLTRATVSPGADNVFGTADDIGPVNTTTAYVDQNQTYTSHSSHQVFLRQYQFNANGDPVATGKLAEGGNGGMATWGEVKEQARTLLGINLTDNDVGSVPLLRTDQYGNFIPGPNGFPQVITGVGPDGIPNTADDVVIEGDPAANGGTGISTAAALRTNSAFLADIAHEAVPIGKLADGDITIGLGNPGNGDAEYDNELLDAHFIAGDGRVNENIGLTAVHHVFHSEHNRLVEHTKETVLATGDLAFINEWLAVDVLAVPTPAQYASLVWDGERLFQAAKFGTEMQYQHLVFEEFARKIQPNINVFLVPDGFDTTINPDIVAEFAHVVYRFGHSMLTESIDRFDPAFAASHIGLVQGFLNPVAFDGGDTGVAHTITDDVAAGAIIRGMTRQVGNQIDEFVTTALRNNLLGLPLDLATINLARGRDVGAPSLNEARAHFYEATNGEILLKPYESWVDFAGHLKHEASIINFIAAYGTHALITGATTLQEKRDAALTIITGVSTGGFAVPADSVDFLNATGAYAGGSLGGLNNVDLWIGGLAEETMPFGGMLGSTFNFVFEVQMESLQNADRFYYLQRLDGLHLFGEMEANSFSSLIMRNTDATHLPSDVFSTPALILEVDQSKQFNDLDGNGTLESTDPVGSSLLTPLVIRNNPATAGTDANYLRYTGADHVILGGTEAADTLVGSIGDDALFGDGGNDFLEGGFGNDILNAGDGDDIVKDSGGDDNIKAGAGNDVVNSGNGLDLVLAGAGQDFIVLGTDMGSEVFGGEGNDFILGNKNAERILGNEGNDWLETGTFDGAPGDNFDEIFARDGIDGHDVFLGDGGFDEFIGEGGDDIMVGSPGRGKMAGMSGFDWVTYKDGTAGVNADLSIPIVFDEAPTLPPNTALDEFESMEGLSGSRFDDVLSGSDAVAAERLPLSQGGSQGFTGSALDAQGISLVNGLQAVLGTGVSAFSAGDILLGGDGSDLIRGRGGDDVIDGDKWLDVQIGVFAPGDTGHTGTPIALHNSMKTLSSAMFAGTINPGQLAIVRTIRTDTTAGDVDIAAFSENRANYDIIQNADRTVTVVHARGSQADGTDTLRNIERLRFADGDLSLNSPVTGAAVISDLTPTEGQQLSVDTSSIADADGLGALSFQWQSSPDGVTWSNIAGATAATFTPDDNPGTLAGDQAGLALRVVVSFTDGAGTVETVASAPTGPTGMNWVGTNGADVFDGTAGDDIASAGPGQDTLNGNAGDDMLTGGTGADLIVGGAGYDTANYSGSVAAVTAELWRADAVTGLLFVTDGTGSYDQIGGVEALVGGSAADLLSGDNAANALQGGGGNDTLNGGGGDDNVDGGANDDYLFGSVGADTVLGQVGNDTIFGGDAGFSGGDLADSLAGGGGNDFLIGELGNDTLDGGLANDFLVGGYFGSLVSGDDSMLGGDGLDTLLGEDGNDTLDGGNQDDFLIGGTGNDSIRGGDGIDLLVGDGFGAESGDDTIDGGLGNDQILAGLGNDTIIQTGATGGRDFVNGGAGADTYQLNGAAGAETFRIYTRAEAELAGMSVLHAATEIVITRNGTTNAEIIAELDNIEEIAVNTLQVSAGGVNGGASGGDTIQVIGDFTTTSLNFNTITIDGNAGDDTIDITSLSSAHRIVFRSNGGHDTIIGTLRPQDVIELPQGSTIADYTVTTGTNGVTTMTSASHSVAFTSADGLPAFGENPAVDDDDEEASPPPAEGTGGASRTGTAGADVLIGTAAANDLIGLAGDDVLMGEGGNDAILGGEGDDLANAGDGRDMVFAGAGDDHVFGGAEADMLYGDGGHDRLFGDAGNDMLTGGEGSDTVVGGAGDDTIIAAQGDGDDVYFGDASDGGDGRDTLDLSAITAAISVDLGSGLGGRGSASSSQSGQDTLWRIEDLVTGSGADTITAGNAANVMDGGDGNDTFRFLSVEATQGDLIVDFEPGDRLDVSAIDADAGMAGNQGFTLVSGPQFTAAAQLMVVHETRDGVEYTVVKGSVDATPDEDFRIELKGTVTLIPGQLVV